MPERAHKGEWLEIKNLVLPVGERASQVPEDTKKVPLVLKVKGFLVQPDVAIIGDEVLIETRTGRCVQGFVCNINPPYSHSFGAPIAELLSIGREVRAILQELSPDQNPPAEQEQNPLGLL